MTELLNKISSENLIVICIVMSIVALFLAISVSIEFFLALALILTCIFMGSVEFLIRFINSLTSFGESVLFTSFGI